jgi:SHS2 domain-containing protein
LVIMDDMSAPRSLRGHEMLPHTADVGLRAWGPTREEAFEEAAVALGELTAEVATGSQPVRERTRRIELEARDLPGLAFAWLNEIVGLVDLDGAIRAVRVVGIEPIEEGWRLTAALGLAPFDGALVRRRADVKSATYHGLAVEDQAGTWSVTAYLDV